MWYNVSSFVKLGYY